MDTWRFYQRRSLWGLALDSGHMTFLFQRKSVADAGYTVDIVYTADMVCTVDMVYTVDMVDTVDNVYTVYGAFLGHKSDQFRR